MKYIKLTAGKLEDYIRVRRGFEKLMASHNRPESAGYTYTPVQINGVPCEWIVPEGCDSKKVLVYFHGGGYHFGSINTTRSIVQELARLSGSRALMVEYRKAPEHRY